ncbi:MAG: DNA gyrase inhibitor YacG [Burkholderiaceae bacterium]|nr:DNA gyrase inhibitor YacG [Burkholderiaceae bacterium]MDO9089865.1 DNA gyrase inhibitor YacG [Burkholderiaceae bacterium]MDP1968018.1 DNA gyrase inhibitor YacG [Burkholderiaceae bacterium]
MTQPAQPNGLETPRIVRCPACGGDSVYAASNPSRPFCSPRCKNLDFGAWASEQFRMPADAPPDDEPFGDPKER